MALRVLERGLECRKCSPVSSVLMHSNIPTSIANTSRSWGDMVREYGNSLKDMTGAAGSRAPTKGNPLGLSTGGGGGGASTAVSSTRGKGTASNPLGL
jgi:hypothetical protein